MNGEKLTYEEKQLRVKEILVEIEKESLSLEKRLNLFEEANTLIVALQDELKAFEARVKVVTANGLEDFIKEEIDE